MPAWNAAPWIGAALASLTAQTHTDWSAVVVDDGSTDSTAATVAAHPDPRVWLLRQDNAGVSAARNRGMDAPGGDVLLFLDADDWLAPDALARLAATLGDADPEVGAAYGAFCFVDATGSQVLRHKGGPFPAGDILPRLLVENLFANGGHLLIRRAVADAAGRFRPGIAYGEDWEYWVRLALRTRFAAVPGAAPLLFVRQRPGGAYLRMVTRPESYRPCLDAAFGNPALAARLGGVRVAALRRQAEAEMQWVIGRELIRQGEASAGRRFLARSLGRRPLPKRIALAGMAVVAPWLPAQARGPFRPYPPTG